MTSLSNIQVLQMTKNTKKGLIKPTFNPPPTFQTSRHPPKTPSLMKHPLTMTPKLSQLSFMLPPNFKEQAKKVCSNHMALLQLLIQDFPDTKISTNNCTSLEKLDFSSYLNYHKQFHIYSKPRNPMHSQKDTYQVIHKSETQVSITTILSHPSIKNLLKGSAAYLNNHALPEEVSTSCSIDWQIGIDPCNMTIHQYNSELMQLFKDKNKTLHPPNFRCTFIHPTVILPSGKKYPQLLMTFNYWRAMLAR